MDVLEQQFLVGLDTLARQGGIGIGLNHPLPREVQLLVASGHCSILQLPNPHQLEGVPEAFVTLTDLGRIESEARFNQQGRI